MRIEQLVVNADCCECSGVWRCWLLRYGAKALLRKWSPKGGVQRLVMLSCMELDVDPDLLHRRQPAADAACCRAPAGESTAAQTKPARAGVRCKGKCRSCEMHMRQWAAERAKCGQRDAFHLSPRAVARCCRLLHRASYAAVKQLGL